MILAAWAEGKRVLEIGTGSGYQAAVLALLAREVYSVEIVEPLAKEAAERLGAVYVPLNTPLLAAARANGLKTADGLGMLLHQAVRGFSLWFGVTPEVTRVLHDLVARDIDPGYVR